MKRIFIGILCSLLLAAFLTPTATAADIPQIVRDATKSVLRVYSEDELYYYTGSGFVIAHDGDATYLATNLHVVSNLGESNTITVFTNSSYILTVNRYSSALQAEVMVLSPNLDLAILKVEGLTDRPALPLAESGNVEQGDGCYVLGFPGSADDLRDDGQDLPSTTADVNITDGSISQKGGEYNGQSTYQHTAYMNHGNSGGPLLNEAGEVIGVNTYGFDGVFRSIFIDYIVDFCRDAGIPITTGTGDATPETQPDSESSPPPIDEEDSGASWWIYIIAGIGAVVIGCSLTIAVRKKKTPQEAPSFTPEQIPVGAGVMQSPYSGAQQRHLTGIRGIGGQFNTISFPIPNKIALGRDPGRCTVIFAAQTAGVSGLHCEVVRQGDGFQLIDRGSSYGTFLDNGTKLLPNVPVNLGVGQGFYLGDRRNSFTVY